MNAYNVEIHSALGYDIGVLTIVFLVPSALHLTEDKYNIYMYKHRHSTWI